MGNGGLRMSWDDLNKSLLPEVPGWPERYRGSSRLKFAREMSEDDARWWHSTFVQAHNLYPEDVAEKLAGPAPGEFSFRYDFIEPLDQSFMLSMEGKEGNRQIWFQASEVRLKDRFVYADRMDVDAEFRGRQTAQKLMSGIADFALTMDCRRIELVAQDIGGYLWATAGCLPVGSWIGIKSAVVSRLGRLLARREISADTAARVNRLLEAGERDPRMIWAIARLRQEVISSHARSLSDPPKIALGKELLIGVEWKGEIDFDKRFSRLAFHKFLRRR
jgi:hypothetical protein